MAHIFSRHSRGKVQEKVDVEEESSKDTSAADQSVARLDRGTESLAVVSPAKNVFEQDPTEGEYNLKTLHDPENADLDIIFIHGLTGNRESTWTRKLRKSSPCLWPRDLLPDDILNARIATWGYDADVINMRPFKVVSKNSVEQHAETLCSDLANARTGDLKDRPLVFVVHSLGGIVLKTALLHANESRTHDVAHIKNIADSTQAIAFMGTPHQGSVQASWGSMLASILGYIKQDNVDIVKGLEKEASRLQELQKRFNMFLASRTELGKPISVTCFYEELDVPVLGMIVPSQSATLGGPSIGIHANHIDMIKFGSEESPGYVRVLGELKRWAEATERKNRTDDQLLEDPKRMAASLSQPTYSVTHRGHVSEGGVAMYAPTHIQAPTTIGGYTQTH